ncbi:conserved hypothetical protein [Burkholderiales bacterium 8X]|nr:conserved hypothetical protein [Burkholderiales bacterium 8X]
MQTISAILWRKLDSPGHDACRLEQSDSAWQLDGCAVFLESSGRTAQLHYRVRCDKAWRTQWGTVKGWLGGRTVDACFTRDARGKWKRDDDIFPNLERCIDLDLGFTPATNLIALRRMNLAIGESAEAPAAWLDLSADHLDELSQRYRRTSDSCYAYDAPRFGYAASLEVAPIGFVLHYPGLWQVESISR